MKKLGKFTIVVLCFILLLFIGPRYGWRLFGFNACVDPTAIITYDINVSDDHVNIKGFTSQSAPSFVGYVYKIENDNIYVGLKYNTLFGFIRRNGEFDINVKCDTSNLSGIYFKNGNGKKVIWEKA